MQINDTEWELLARLRERFLGGRGATLRDYWDSARTLELYDGTFGQRIAWKWRAVLAEIALRGGLGKVASVVDWGCGSGIASREFAVHSGAERYVLWDRSSAG